MIRPGEMGWRRGLGKSGEWRVESDWIDAVSFLLISAQSFKGCNPVMRRVNAPQSFHLFETN